MKVDFKNLAVATVAFAIGVGFNSMAISSLTSNVAVVDVQKVVAASPEVQALKKEQQVKAQDLQKWITVAREDVAKQSTEAGKQKLAKKYEADFEKKQKELQKDYANKLAEIDKTISGVIAKEAQGKGYSLVLNKGAVLYGGVDITKTINTLLKK